MEEVKEDAKEDAKVNAKEGEESESESESPNPSQQVEHPPLGVNTHAFHNVHDLMQVLYSENLKTADKFSIIAENTAWFHTLKEEANVRKEVVLELLDLGGGKKLSELLLPLMTYTRKLEWEASAKEEFLEHFFAPFLILQPAEGLSENQLRTQNENLEAILEDIEEAGPETKEIKRAIRRYSKTLFTDEQLRQHITHPDFLLNKAGMKLVR